MRRKNSAILMAGLGLAACDAGSTRDVTAPDVGSAIPDATEATARHLVVRPTGEAMSPPPVRADPPVTRRQPRAVSPASAVAAAVAAAVTVCDAGVLDPDGLPEGGLTGGTYDDIEVPPGKICVLQDATVTNSVRALVGSRLFIRNSQIGGNVEGVGASSIQVSEETHIGGDMTVLNADDLLFASCAVDNATIAGDLTCAQNDPGSPVIRANRARRQSAEA